MGSEFISTCTICKTAARFIKQYVTPKVSYFKIDFFVILVSCACLRRQVRGDAGWCAAIAATICNRKTEEKGKTKLHCFGSDVFLESWNLD